ncbi:MAG: hypothetical protein WD036_08255, partial [Bauldia sp.]
MRFCPLIPACAAIALMLASAGPLAAASDAGNGAAELAGTGTRYPLYDRTTDPIVAAIRAILDDAGTHGAFLDKRDAAAVAEFYQEQGFAPAWTRDGRLTERAEPIIRRVHQADLDGLDPYAYRTPVIGMGSVVPVSVAITARADVMLSRAIVAYARHANSGRYDPADISPNIDYKPHLPDPIAVLSNVATAADPAAALASYNPTHPQFLRLRDKLAEIRATETERPPVVPAGPNLKLGAKDPRVAVLRQRLKVAAAAAPDRFDEAVDEAIRAFQESVGL